ncbi:MAG TPA: YqgE/AlgH family protein [Candidatus Binatia bacterium]|nr:YqgE/AlgH family protein [Candidatus Binatia bacterium]
MDEFAAPALIIAMPDLLDPNFHRTVVLLIEKNDQGAFGVVINRAGDSKVHELCVGLNVDWGGDESTAALYGGPVGTQQGFLLHGEVADDVVVNSREVSPGVRIASDMETFRTLCRRPPTDLRILLGYAGWAPGQLEIEMRSGAWLTAEVTPDIVFRTPLESIWDRTLRGLGIDPSMLVAGGGVH